MDIDEKKKEASLAFGRLLDVLDVSKTPNLFKPLSPI
jgi:hypothetical protein